MIILIITKEPICTRLTIFVRLGHKHYLDKSLSAQFSFGKDVHR